MGAGEWGRRRGRGKGRRWDQYLRPSRAKAKQCWMRQATRKRGGRRCCRERVVAVRTCVSAAMCAAGRSALACGSPSSSTAWKAPVRVKRVGRACGVSARVRSAGGAHCAAHSAAAEATRRPVCPRLAGVGSGGAARGVTDGPRQGWAQPAPRQRSQREVRCTMAREEGVPLSAERRPARAVPPFVPPPRLGRGARRGHSFFLSCLILPRRPTEDEPPAAPALRPVTHRRQAQGVSCHAPAHVPRRSRGADGAPGVSRSVGECRAAGCWQRRRRRW